jgi:hypothetical protein
VADRLQFPDRMVVPLIVLGSITKLGFATAATHKTRVWWLPGILAILVGALATLAAPTRSLGEISLVLGVIALGGCRWIRAR